MHDDHARHINKGQFLIFFFCNSYDYNYDTKPFTQYLIHTKEIRIYI